MTNVRAVLVEDDEKICELLSCYLSNNNFDVTCVNDGAEAAAVIITQQPDIVILDLMLPNADGFTIYRQIKPSYQGKTLFLTASEDDFDQVTALEMGADDFVSKPVQPRVLLARLRMLLRRQNNLVTPTLDPNQINFGELSLDKQRKQCLLSNLNIKLTSSEFDLLWLLSSHAEEVLSREFLVKTLRGIEYDGVDRTIDNKVVILRKKLGDNPALPRKIITVRGKGYLFVPERW
ncbi:response regulator [Psychromonas sp. RZ22]|uniref:response regulator n=1 Tax=Psychromonas algarum TaxID=2555643 RepID=UPI001067A9A3|nr:response regulator [Psychromonas sp. RZ22]TEW53647.1 response regulator [Psychromonas sp. RZ22]